MAQKIVIVGGGISGLTAGIYAQKAGFESEVYEKHSIPGGQCTGWNRKGFYIDNCISWMTNAAKEFPIYPMWREVGFLEDADGNEIKCLQHDAFYTSELDGKKVTLWRDLDRAEKEMLALAPEDAKQIKELFKCTRACKTMRVPFKKPVDLMNPIELAAFGLASAPMGPVITKYAKISIEDFSKTFKNPLLQKMMTDYLPVKYLAYVFFCAYATIASGGGGVPDGGSSRVVDRMVEKYKRLGGKLFTKSPVQKIILNEQENHATGILLENGDTVTGDYVIASTDAHYTFERLLDQRFMPKTLQAAYADNQANPLGSSFQVAYEYDGVTKDINRRTFFDCKPFTLAGKEITRMNMKNYDLEPTTAPEGKNLIQVKILEDESEYLYWENLYKNDRDEYNHQKQGAAIEILRRIEEHVPSARGKMKILDTWTPVTYNRYCNAYRGVYMSFTITKDSKGLFNIPGVIDGIDNVFISGQWLCLPGGLPEAMVTGKFAIQRILRSQHKPIKIEP